MPNGSEKTTYTHTQRIWEPWCVLKCFWLFLLIRSSRRRSQRVEHGGRERLSVRTLKYNSLSMTPTFNLSSQWTQPKSHLKTLELKASCSCKVGLSLFQYNFQCFYLTTRGSHILLHSHWGINYQPKNKTKNTVKSVIVSVIFVHLRGKGHLLTNSKVTSYFWRGSEFTLHLDAPCWM